MVLFKVKKSPGTPGAAEATEGQTKLSFVFLVIFSFFLQNCEEVPHEIDEHGQMVDDDSLVVDLE